MHRLVMMAIMKTFFQPGEDLKKQEEASQAKTKAANERAKCVV
eukprot:CAMPEP_0194215978 /NCGR_PEP_ID=MMETSP0156-20130528/18154_1 /TAXON_ID=33649 /ORGANISM="Thalassionema nitzschioides, Strain L26-B" /LENGTH=42 /DNA_ID= /DNA_START= /DNA_END= /DNA_ORIENTATION=